MRREVNTADGLREIVGHPNSYVANKVGNRLTAVQQDWLAHSPLGFVATTDAQGRVDVSPKGDPPGFVHIIDDTTIAIPERPGNKRVDGYLNVSEHVGTLFLIPGRGDTLRINGTARILADADYFDAMTVQGKPPILAQELEKYYAEENIRKVLYYDPRACVSALRHAAKRVQTRTLAALRAFRSG